MESIWSALPAVSAHVNQQHASKDCEESQWQDRAFDKEDVPLTAAARAGRTRVVDLLLQAGDDLNKALQGIAPFVFQLSYTN